MSIEYDTSRCPRSSGAVGGILVLALLLTLGECYLVGAIRIATHLWLRKQAQYFKLLRAKKPTKWGGIMSGNKSLMSSIHSFQILKELKHYRGHLHGKTIYCNCDDPIVSNFFRYFCLNFAKLRLKKLITTCYRNQQPDLFSTHDKDSAVGIEYTDKNTQYAVFELNGDGDFRSQECIEILKKSDVVVTNSFS